MQNLDFSSICGRFLPGNEQLAYRDPAACFVDGRFHIFFTLVEKHKGTPCLCLATVISRDLKNFSPVRRLTEYDPRLNYSSPGSIIPWGGEYVLCLQTYPRPKGEKYGDESARIFIMRTSNFESWSSPELLRVKGPDVPENEMGRMIDPFLLIDKDDPGLVWCFYKQNGVSLSYSRDLLNWTFHGHTQAGENVCVLAKNGSYYMFHSPKNGIGILQSYDLKKWKKAAETVFLKAHEAQWSKGRVTAGFVMDLAPWHDKFLMLYHASGPEDESVDFDKNASLAIAVSDDLLTWD
ncbi:MAG: hypothetical protein ACOX8S_06500 [Christensenellales bacterium]|jgi:hypothetical protein